MSTLNNKRYQLHDILCGILGSRDVYFQPPPTVRMKYPAIVYVLDDIESTHADDRVYLSRRKYLVTVIEKDPDSELIGKVASLPLCRYNRHYEKDNLHHDVFELYY